MRSRLGRLRFALVLIALVVIPQWAGVSATPVLSGSMAPAFSTGDLAVTVSAVLNTPELGDVIVFDAEVNGQVIAVMHRIVAVSSTGTFTTRGDDNPNPDPWTVAPGDVSAVVMGSVPTGQLR
jgi:signal peptidase